MPVLPQYRECLHIDSIHGVFGAEHDPGNRNETIRHAAIETYRAEGELALDLDGPMFVVHPAQPPVTPPATGLP